MKLTLEEKVERLSQALPEQGRVVYHLTRKDGEYSSQVMLNKKTKKIENYTLFELGVMRFDGALSTPIEVYEYRSYEDLINWMEEMDSQWLGDVTND